MKEQIVVKNGPPPAGPYSLAIRANGLVFVSGQGPVVPETGEILRGSIEEQVHQTMRNIRSILAAAGSSFEKVVKTNIYLRDLANFKRMNEVYGQYMGSVPPARTTIQAADLPMGIDVEIDVIALA
jgi:2-iminobutanoate/2-iminopropanoate deaminase